MLHSVPEPALDFKGFHVRQRMNKSRIRARQWPVFQLFIPANDAMLAA
jgi:hypothetical protein